MLTRSTPDAALVMLGAELEGLDRVVNTSGLVSDDDVHVPLARADELVDLIAAIPAAGLPGLVVKAQAVRWLYRLASEPIEPEDGTPLEMLQAGLVQDLLRLADGGSATRTGGT